MPLVLYPASLAAVLALLHLFTRYDHGYGPLRAGLLIALAAVLVAATRLARPLPQPRVLAAALTATAAALLVWNVAIGLLSVEITTQTGHIAMDQGQFTHRAALLLLREENPYGVGVLVEPVTWEARRQHRPQPENGHALQQWWNTLDPRFREQALPKDTSPKEKALLGYKYGPLQPLLAVPLVHALDAGGIPLLNLLFYLAFVAGFAVTLKTVHPGPVTALAALVALLVDEFYRFNFLEETASDIGGLAFCSLALLAWYRRRPTAMGILLALSLGAKLLPGALMAAALLARARSLQATAAFALTLTAVFGPWLVLDPDGLAWSYLLHALVRHPDDTSWMFEASATTVSLLKPVLAGLVLAALWRCATKPDLLKNLALLHLAMLLLASKLHNNYLPWVAWLMYLALADGFRSEKAQDTPTPGTPAPSPPPEDWESPAGRR